MTNIHIKYVTQDGKEFSQKDQAEIWQEYQEKIYALSKEISKIQRERDHKIWEMNMEISEQFFKSLEKSRMILKEA